MDIRISLDFGEHGGVRPAELFLSLEKGPAESTVSGLVRVVVDALPFDGFATINGYDLHRFVEGLTAMHDKLVGSSDLLDWDEQVLASFTMTGGPPSFVVVKGVWRFFSRVSGDNADPTIFGRGFNAGLVVAFQGLRTDQSYLPGIIGDFKRLLRETEVSTSNPNIAP